MTTPKVQNLDETCTCGRALGAAAEPAESGYFKVSEPLMFSNLSKWLGIPIASMRTPYPLLSTFHVALSLLAPPAV